MVETTDDDINYDYDNFSTTGTPTEDRDTLLKQVFHTEERTEILRRSLRGETPRGDNTWIKLPNELAGDLFVNKQIASFRAIVNDLNTFTRKNEKECKRILKDSIDAFLSDALYDETVDTQDIRTLSKMFEHSLELFLGLVEFGHGARVLNSILTGKSINFSDNNKKEKTFMEWMSKK